MRIEVLADPAAVARRAAGVVADVLRATPDAVLGLATGGTMRPVYDELVALQRRGEVDFTRATTLNLDEYAGLAADHPASFAAYMRAALFSRVPVDPARIHLMRGDAPDPQAEARRYEAAITAAGGIGLQLLGIGRNGHIAFNEPGTEASTRTRLAPLAAATQQVNAPAFHPQPVPERALTMGIATILEARRCLLVATGADKAPAVARMVQGPVGPDCPASFLRGHPDVTVLLDPAAARDLAAAAPSG